jgi:hypothetical protein
MGVATNVERLGTERVGNLLWEMSSQTTLSLLVYAIYSITDMYFLSAGIILIKLPVLLLTSRLFSLSGIWLSEAASELILAFISLVVMRKSITSY